MMTALRTDMMVIAMHMLMVMVKVMAYECLTAE